MELNEIDQNIFSSTRSVRNMEDDSDSLDSPLRIGNSRNHTSISVSKPPLSPQQNNKTSWNHRIESSIKEIGQKSTGYKIMHVKEAKKLSQFFMTLMYIGICIGPVSGMISSLGSIMTDSPPTAFELSSSVMSFASGIIMAVIKFGKYEQKSSSHKLAASRYTSLESNIRRQLMLNKSDRISASQYVKWVTNSFDELFLASPLVTSKIYNNYAEHAEKRQIIIPEKYESKIYINPEYSENRLRELADDSDIKIHMGKERKTTHHEDDQVKGDKEVKRTDEFGHFSDINKYGNGQMRYELGRMFGFETEKKTGK
jgi:hypothetical protein